MGESNGNSMYPSDPLIQTEKTETEIVEQNNKKSHYGSEILDIPPDCCPAPISKHFSRCSLCIPESIKKLWTLTRRQTLRFVEHRYFEWFIIVSILVSSATLVS